MNKLSLAIAPLVLISAQALAKSDKGIAIYDDTYVMQTYTSDINQDVYDNAYGSGMDKLKNAEVKYQFSLSVPLAQTQFGSLMASYTQLSLWQLGNTEASSPFRETNYKPQLFMMHQGKFVIFNNIEYGYRHQSNGKDKGTSRSWDMGYIALERVNSKLEYGVQGWYAASLSENKDIEDFIPPYEVWAKYHGSMGSIKVRTAYNFSTDKGHVEAAYTLPINKYVGFYVQVFEGYGESMIDYNHNQTRVGAGITLTSTTGLM
ncbi:phospholipase A [Vibrio sp. Sgm 22]|uniref:phospholipase A n=1 Tax=unclassified Vibrio TaxID=2614977 RepID=UPI00224961F0|nr:MULTISPECIES: phospholipase A [unclassified Vibrio]MCX2760054.1 phospholipase A [Vibrio sp. 14G-20]MCX2777042.1 phospholipase A [Vibrio sp. Sgm 22]